MRYLSVIKVVILDVPKGLDGRMDISISPLSVKHIGHIL
jgi:hypothetical protein